MYYARIARYEIPRDNMGENLRKAEETETHVRMLPGNKGMYYFIDRTTGQAMSVTLWENEEALMASEAEGERLRSQLVRPTMGKVVSVERCEVYLGTCDVGEIRESRAA